MADGMTPAYDAFSQTRDTGTKERVTERRRVDTYTNPNRYQMPPNRRLYVQADPVDVTVTPSDGTLAKLAEGLAKVKPQLMDYFISKEVEKNIQSVEEGKKEAMATEAARAGDQQFFDDQWKEYGYNVQKSFLHGEELGKQLQIDAANRDLSESWDEWYNKWWFDQQMNGKTPKTRNYIKEFNKGFASYRGQAKVNDLVEIDKKDTAEQLRVASETVYTYYKDLYEKNPQNIADDDSWLGLKQDLTYLNRLTHSDQEKIKVAALIRIAEEERDVLALDPLMRPAKGFQVDANGVDQVITMPTALYSDPRYHEAIKGSMEKIASEKRRIANEAYTKAQREKAQFEEFEKEGHKEISLFIGYDEFIQLPGDPAANEVARVYDDLAKKEFTQFYTDYLNKGMSHAEARDKAVETVKDRLYGMESEAHFKARRDYITWYNDTSAKIKLTVGTETGRQKLAEVYETEGADGFARLFGKIDEPTHKQLEELSKIIIKNNEIQNKPVNEKLDQTIQTQRTKVKRSELYMDNFRAIKKANPTFSDEEIYKFMDSNDKYKDL